MPYKDKNKEKARKRAYRLAHLEDRRAWDKAYYIAHREEKQASNRAYRQAHPDGLKAYDKAYNQVHREERKANTRAYYHAHSAQHNAKHQNRNHALTAEARRFLGNKCACPGCAVSESAFLTIDHIHGRPKESKRNAVFEARASGWDRSKFQILCANCNFAKHDRGFCPVHQTAPRPRNGHSPGANAQQSLWTL